MIKNKNIQILRGVSLLLVVLYHLDLKLFQSGFIGVDIFFVISGYLITRKITEGNYKVFYFYKKRVSRLMPALLFNLSIFSIILYKIDPRIFITENLEHLLYSLTQSFNIYQYKFGDSYFETLTGKSPFTHLWSLGVEEQFYIFWPVFLLILLRVKYKWKIATIIFLSSASLISFIMLDQKGSFYLPTSRFWELGAGGLLALIMMAKEKNIIEERMIDNALDENRKKGSNYLVKTSMNIYITLILSLIISTTGMSSKISSIVVVFLSLFYIYNTEKIENKRNILWNFFHKIGDMSYSLYLVHYFVIISILRITTDEKMRISYIPITVILIFVMGLISYRIEIKLNNIKYFNSIFIVLIASITTLFSIQYYSKETTSLSSYTVAPDRAYLKKAIEESIRNDSEKILVKSRPALEELAKDKFKFPTDQLCPKGVRACVIEKNHKKKIILYGDSHAQMYWPSIFYLSKKYNFESYLIFKGGCPPAKLNIDMVRGGDDYFPKIINDCNKFYDSAIEKLRSSDEQNLIIIAGSHQTAKWIDNFDKTLKELENKKILYIGNFQYPREDILDCYYNGERNFSCLSKKSGKFINEKELEKNILLRYKVEMLDAKDYLCQEEICPGIIGNTKVYQDRNHISNAYAYFLSEVIYQDIKKYLEN